MHHNIVPPGIYTLPWLRTRWVVLLTPARLGSPAEAVMVCTRTYRCIRQARVVPGELEPAAGLDEAERARILAAAESGCAATTSPA